MAARKTLVVKNAVLFIRISSSLFHIQRCAEIIRGKNQVTHSAVNGPLNTFNLFFLTCTLQKTILNNSACEITAFFPPPQRLLGVIGHLLGKLVSLFSWQCMTISQPGALPLSDDQPGETAFSFSFQLNKKKHRKNTSRHGSTS